MRGELAVELGEQRDAVGDAKLPAGRNERRVLHRERAVDDEARAGKRLKNRHQRRIAHPVMRPGDAAAQRQYRIGIDRQHPVEARAQFAPGVGGVAAIETERKAIGDQPGLGVARRVEVLRLDSCVRRDAGVGCREAVAAFEPPAVALGVEVGGQMVANGEPVGGHPVISEGERRREIGRAGFRRAVDAGLEGIALAAAEPLRQAPVGAGAGEREAHHRVRREAIIEAGRAARGARGEIMAAALSFSMAAACNGRWACKACHRTRVMRVVESSRQMDLRSRRIR